MLLFDYPEKYPDGKVSEVAEKIFQEHYLHPLGDDIRFVQLKSGFRVKLPKECVLMFFGRNAYARQSLRRSH